MKNRSINAIKVTISQNYSRVNKMNTIQQNNGKNMMGEPIAGKGVKFLS